MSHVLEFLQLWHAVEPYKAYPREPWVLGRVRVRLVDEDGVPWNPEVPDRECGVDFVPLVRHRLRLSHPLRALSLSLSRSFSSH